MKKFHAQPLGEILATHFTQAGDYLEQAFTLMTSDFLQVSSGVINGLAVSSGTLTTVSVDVGNIYQDGKFGTLESASGVTLSLPSSGSRTDLIVCSYLEVYDSPVSGFVLLDVATGDESVEDNPTRRFGAAIIQQLTNTTYATCPAGKIPLCELTMNSSGMTGLTDVRVYARIQRLQVDIKQNFINMFFAGF